MNLWKSFDRLMQTGGPRFIGEVTAINPSFGDVRCTVTLLPGGTSLEVSANGRDVEIGQHWLIQDGQIIGDAPGGSVVYVDI